MSNASPSGGNKFIVKVDAASAGKKKAILPGYRPEVVRVLQINADGDEYIGVSGDEGTGAAGLVKRDQAGAVTFKSTDGFEFRDDGVEFRSAIGIPRYPSWKSSTR